MKNKIWVILLVVLVIIVSYSLGGSSKDIELTELRSSLQSLYQRYENAVNELETLHNTDKIVIENDKLKAKITKLRGEIKSLEYKVADYDRLNKSYRGLASLYRAKNNKCYSLHIKNSALSKRNKQLSASVKYLNNRNSHLNDLLFNAQTENRRLKSVVAYYNENEFTKKILDYNSSTYLPSHPTAENNSYYGQISERTGRPKTVHVRGYYRKDGTYVRSHYRSRPRR